MKWNILESQKNHATHNMELDKLLLEKLKNTSECFLHFYDWTTPSITYGYFLSPEEHLSLTHVKNLNISLARRPTGGGILFHGKDLTFSIILPSKHPSYSLNTIENYAFINKLIQKALQKTCIHLTFSLNQNLNFHDPYKKYCMASPTIYDILVDGKKVCGGAQRRKNYGFLHQASILLSIPSKEELSCLLNKEVAFKIEKQSYPLLDSKMDLIKLKSSFKKNLIEEITKTLT